MANQDAPELRKQLPHAGEYGSVSSTVQSITLAAAAIGDVFRFAKIPANSRLLDLEVINTASTALTAMSFGYENDDGTGAVPAHFAPATSIATAARLRASSVNPPVLLGTKDAYITGTLAGANIAVATTITVRCTYEYIGRQVVKNKMEPTFWPALFFLGEFSCSLNL